MLQFCIHSDICIWMCTCRCVGGGLTKMNVCVFCRMGIFVGVWVCVCVGRWVGENVCAVVERA